MDCELPPPATTPRAPLPPPLVGPCDLQGWCWEHPQPFRAGLGPVWHRQDQTIVTSDRGAVLRLRGETWEVLEPLPEPETLPRAGQPEVHDIWAAGDRLYLAGSIGIEGVLWIHDGAAFTVHHFEDGFVPWHLFGTREREVMLVGLGGARIWRDGDWIVTDPPRSTGQGVWGCGDTYVAALFQGSYLDEEALIGRYRDGGWTKTGDLPEVNVQFTAVSGTGPDDVFAVGTVNGLSEEVAWHFDGHTWTDIDYGDSPGLYDIVAVGRGQAIATGVDAGGGGSIKRYADGVWTTIHDGAVLQLSAATAEDVLGRGNLALLQFDGTSWFEPFPLPNPSDLGARSFTGLWGDGNGALFLIASDGAIFQRAGASWEAMYTPDPVARSPAAVWGATAGDVFVVGSRGLVWHFDGSAWTEMTLPLADDSRDLTGIWGADGSTVYAVGNAGTILRYDGASWTRDDLVAEDLVGIWGASPTDIWAVGDRGRLVHYDGLAWDDSARLPGDNPAPAAIWGSGPTDVWVAGEDRVWHYDGATWSEEILETPASGRALFGRGPADVYLVGQSGMAFHFDGAGWTDIHAEHPWTFNALWGDDAELRAVGDLAVISRRSLP